MALRLAVLVHPCADAMRIASLSRMSCVNSCTAKDGSDSSCSNGLGVAHTLLPAVCLEANPARSTRRWRSAKAKSIRSSASDSIAQAITTFFRLHDCMLLCVCKTLKQCFLMSYGHELTALTLKPDIPHKTEPFTHYQHSHCRSTLQPQSSEYHKDVFPHHVTSSFCLVVGACQDRGLKRVGGLRHGVDILTLLHRVGDALPITAAGSSFCSTELECLSFNVCAQQLSFSSWRQWSLATRYSRSSSTHTVPVAISRGNTEVVCFICCLEYDRG